MLFNIAAILKSLPVVVQLISLVKQLVELLVKGGKKAQEKVRQVSDNRRTETRQKLLKELENAKTDKDRSRILDKYRKLN